MPVGTWHQAANAVDDNSVGGLSASGNAVNNVETVLGGMQTMGDISAVEIIVVGSEADADTISDNTT